MRKFIAFLCSACLLAMWIVSAQAEALEGFSEQNGRLIYLDKDGNPVKNDTIGTFQFDSEGYYTSGDEELDEYVSEVVSDCVSSDMSQEEQLKAVYNYMILNCSYRMGNIYETGAEGWQIDEAKSLIEKKNRGNCYAYAAMFRELARAVGYPAEAYSGTIAGSDVKNTPHGWVEIVIEDETYVFDPEMQSVQLLQYNNSIDMYMMKANSPETDRWDYSR